MSKILILFLIFLTIVKSFKIQTSEEKCEEEEKKCDVNWKYYERPSGGWCLKVFYENSISQPTAEERCQAHGATLSGFQNQMEASYVTDTVTEHIYPATGSIWVGLKRREPCLTVGRGKGCGWDTSFEWTDKSANGTDGLLWACSQPDNAWNRTQHCAVLLASPSGYVLNFQTGTLDDVGCTFDFIENKRKPRDIKAYVCGKKAKI